MIFSHAQIVGGLFPGGLLVKVRSGDPDLPAARPADYHLTGTDRLGDAAARKWQHLRSVYASYRTELDRLPSSSDATSLTRERWLQPLFTELDFGRLPYQRGGLTVDGRTYPVSHLWQDVPVHLTGWHVSLDRKATKATRAPQSMLQEFLNVSPNHLWGVLSNGRQLRIMRDSASLSGSSYVEFDLEAIFDGDVYNEFFLLYAFLHQSRFEPLPREDGAEPTPADCRLEQWRQYAIDTGVPFRRRLAAGAKAAIERLGTSFRLFNPRVDRALTDGTLTPDDYRHELLRLVYQLIFVFVAEDRGTLLLPAGQSIPGLDIAEARDRYDTYFSTRRLRRLARIRPGDRHTDLWRTTVMVLDALGADGGNPDLALPGLGGLFFRPEHNSPDDGNSGTADAPDRLPPDFLRECVISNEDLLAAVYSLSVTEDGGRVTTVDFKHLGAEELGSVYESLLELRPTVEPGTRAFVLLPLPGNERKTTGSFYTPAALIESLLDSTLDPVLNQVSRTGDPDELLSITVCDPACGSGHFLVAAARRIAKRHAAMVCGDPEPSPAEISRSMRLVTASCVYGVDVNHLAVELAKVSLWMESLEPGRPLSFLDGHLKAGNSLLGATPKLVRKGIPGDAYKPMPGDDPEYATQLRADNSAESGGQGIAGGQAMLSFGEDDEIKIDNSRIAAAVRKITPRPDASLPTIRAQALRLREFERHDPERTRQKQLADAWCAAFVWPKTPGTPKPITHASMAALHRGEELSQDSANLLRDLTKNYAFFHWYLEFPDVFATDEAGENGWSGGFSCVLGNPPWERVKLQEKEFFADRDPLIAKAPNAAARKRMIDDLATSDDDADRLLHTRFTEALRRSADVAHLLRDSGRYPLTGQGDINTYSVFAETARTVLAPGGAAGLVLPTGIATDATTAPFFGDLVRRGALASFLEFENEEFLLSRDVDHRVRFCLLTIAGAHVPAATVSFGARRMSDLPSRSFTLPPEEILLVNPNTGTLPLFRSRKDAEITFGIYRRVPVLIREAHPDRLHERPANPWRLSFMTMFHMANDSRRFQNGPKLERDGWKLAGNVYLRGEGEEAERMLPLHEAKMIHHFDHRYGTYLGQTQAQAKMGTLPRPGLSDKDNPEYAIQPRYWVSEEEVDERLGDRWDRSWLLGWRDICRATDERTLIAGLLPRTAVGHTFPLMITGRPLAWLYANLASLILDYVTRQKIAGTHLTYGYLHQLPVLSPDVYDGPCPWLPTVQLGTWVSDRVLELSYTTSDMAGFAEDLGDSGPPFRWDAERRFEIRCELDAAYFHLYGVARDDIAFIMDSFGAFQRNDPERFARTRARILEIYDAMASAAAGRKPYATDLHPAPGSGLRHTAATAR
ncbi:restriction endonuclease [Nonomuraea sp. WAC 01424]|uniref:Eco57I restriction-modification methylase domain-containing protein n=1 Tax=Nonomuraea sp. WAC 01424 TaxID=2203200 RepID=UPI000F76E675|nr:DNA methyltransferase [Nonomuraea sp. WAC 01424]RSM93737.1 restriction endonuclease [Nonomuraea sp. WAC 01424]